MGLNLRMHSEKQRQYIRILLPSASTLYLPSYLEQQGCKMKVIQKGREWGNGTFEVSILSKGVCGILAW